MGDPLSYTLKNMLTYDEITKSRASSRSVGTKTLLVHSDRNRVATLRNMRKPRAQAGSATPRYNTPLVTLALSLSLWVCSFAPTWCRKPRRISACCALVRRWSCNATCSWDSFVEYIVRATCYCTTTPSVLVGTRA